MPMRSRPGCVWPTLAVCAALGVTLCACGGESTEAQPIDVPVEARPVAPECVTDLGYTVRLTAARQLIAAVEFTRGGEAHAAARPWRRALGALVGLAHAHPGHAGGGAVRGELPGRHLVDWMTGGPLGDARVLPGPLDGADFALATATEADGLAPGDPLIGANLYLEATVTRDGAIWTFAVAIPQDADRRIIGAPVPVGVDPGAPVPLPLALRPVDPFEGDTAFDGVDFAAEDPDGDGHIAPPVDHAITHRLKRAFQAHDHYGLAPGENP